MYKKYICKNLYVNIIYIYICLFLSINFNDQFNNVLNSIKLLSINIKNIFQGSFNR